MKYVPVYPYACSRIFLVLDLTIDKQQTGSHDGICGIPVAEPPISTSSLDSAAVCCSFVKGEANNLRQVAAPTRMNPFFVPLFVPPMVAW
ncbi:hypothetical protein Tph_c12890 [Thermacetogenium phaeum DSM 12270]|uniref:Uncharacterized protein n=1 Tax=Thermacetogenium phaeum (strain ATCC BAA-254 / DSM 26808 / PB) TaxID=1089553 RepID=K4LHS5_THEPS|nr:hypothetical protein [Thermacetogenium phaeum]AFV11510.1 hypothetical protein Tph_c12890 [Thermacetogenium phaeum DSM 12270]